MELDEGDAARLDASGILPHTGCAAEVRIPMPFVEFAGQVVECPHGANLRVVLLRARLPLYTGVARALHCRGSALCGTCAVGIVGEVSEPTEPEQRRLALFPHRADGSLRLACQCNVQGDLKVTKHAGLFGQKTDVPHE